MADEINITKVRGCEEVSKPTTHIRVMADTENGPLVLKVSINATRELLAILARLPPGLGSSHQLQSTHSVYCPTFERRQPHSRRRNGNRPPGTR